MSNKAYRSDKSWRLIIVGNHGSIIPLGHFKTLLFLLVICLVLAVAGAAIMVILYQSQKIDISALDAELKQSREQLQVLRDKRDMLMARLVIAESQLKSANQSNKPLSKENPAPSKTAEIAAEPAPEQKKDRSLAAVAPTPKEPAPAPVPAPITVDVSDVKVSHSVESKTITTGFILKNTTVGSERVSGKSVLLLKGSINGEATAYSIPDVPWENGIPSAKLGRSFFIRNFMTISMSRTAPEQSFSFDRAVIFIFENTGALILKKEIPLDLNYVEDIAPIQPETSKNSKDSDGEADIKDDASNENRPPNPTVEPENSESLQ